MSSISVSRVVVGCSSQQLRLHRGECSRPRGPLARPLHLPSASRPYSVARGRVVAHDGRGDLQKKLDGAYETANGVVEGITDLVPESVPRGTAKLAVTGVAVLLIFSLLQKLLSTFITLGLLAVAGYFFLNVSTGGDGSDDIDAGDSDLDEARKIMDKYK